jgi:hypothetical protein
MEMPPVPFTVATPSLTSHFAGPPPSSFFQRDKSFPSKRTMASEGGGPGSMTRGSPVGGGVSLPDAAELVAAASVRAAKQNKVRKIERFIFKATG